MPSRKKGYYVTKWGQVVPLKRTKAPAKPKPLKIAPNACAADLVEHINATATPDMFQQYVTPRMMTLATVWKRGEFDVEKAAKAFTPIVATAHSEFKHLHPGSKFPWGDMWLTCQLLATQFAQDVATKRWDRLGTAVWSVVTENGTRA